MWYLKTIKLLRTSFSLGTVKECLEPDAFAHSVGHTMPYPSLCQPAMPCLCSFIFTYAKYHATFSLYVNRHPVGPRILIFSFGATDLGVSYVRPR